MHIQETLVTDKQIALELFSENGRYRLPIEGKDYHFPTLEKVHEAFLNQSTYDTIKLTHEGKKSYLHLFMDEIEVFDTKKALRQRLSQDSQGMWAEIRNGQKHYYVEQRGWMSTSYKEITEKECIEKLEHTSTMTKALGIGLGMLALLPGAVEFARHLPIGTKEAAMGLIALNQKNPVLGAMGYSLLPSKVEAQAVGTEFQVNTYTTDDQRSPSVASLNNGGFVVTWTSNGQDGDYDGIFGQRYDANGAAAGTEFQINSYTASLQYSQSIASLFDGGFVVTWQSYSQDGSNYGIFGKRYDSSGVAAGTEFQVNTYTTSSQRYPSVAPLNDGGFVVVWESNDQDGDSYGIFGQRYDGSGLATGTEFQINTYTTANQRYPNVAPLYDGGFVVVWESNGQDGELYGVYGQRYDNNGSPAGSEFQVNTYTTNWQGSPSVAPLNDGGFVIAWDSNGQDGSGSGVYGQRFDSNGTLVGPEFLVNTYTTNDQTNPSVAPLNDGDFMVTWESKGQDGSGQGTYGRRYDSSGSPIGAEFQINTHTTGHQSFPSIAPLLDGGFVVTWVSRNIISTGGWPSITTFTMGQDGDSYGIFGQRYDASGNPISLQVLPSTIVTPTPMATPRSSSQNTPTASLPTTQSVMTGSTSEPSNSPSLTLAITRTATDSPSATPNSSTFPPSNSPSLLTTGNSYASSSATPINTPSPTPVTTGSMLGPTTVSSVESTSNILSTVTAQSSSTISTTPSTSKPLPTMSGRTPTSSMASSAPGLNTQAAVSTSSSRSVTSTSEGAMPIASTSVIGSVENIIYEESYPIYVNDQTVGTYIVSGGDGSLNSSNSNVIYFEFDPSFQPEEGQIITLFYIPEEDVALWEGIEIQSESIECLEPHGYVDTKLGGSSYQIVFEEATCLNLGPTMLATALPLTIN